MQIHAAWVEYRCRVNEECEFANGHFEGANLPFMEDVYLKEYRYFERPIGE